MDADETDDADGGALRADDDAALTASETDRAHTAKSGLVNARSRWSMYVRAAIARMAKNAASTRATVAHCGGW